MNVRDALRQLNPNHFILELVSAARDFGRGIIHLRVPAAIPCPEGTREI
jgi:hypothetical protein